MRSALIPNTTLSACLPMHFAINLSGETCRYTSQVILHEPRQVISRVSDSTLFDHLDTTWEFQPGPTPSTCWLNFHTDFAFRSPLYAQVASVFFDEVSTFFPQALKVRNLLSLPYLHTLCNGFQ